MSDALPYEQVDWNAEATESDNSQARIATLEGKSVFNQINVKDYGAVGDGVTDDSSSLNELIASADDSIIYFANSENYLIESQILIDRDNIVLDLQGQTIEVKSNAGYINGFFLDGCSNVTIQNGIIKSTNDQTRVIGRDGDGSNIMGIHLSTSMCSNIKIKNIEFQNCEYGIKIDDDAHTRIVVEDIKSTGTHQPIFCSGLSDSSYRNLDLTLPIGLTNNLDHGIYIDSNVGENVIFENITIRNGSSTAIKLGSSSADIEGITFINTSIYNATGGVGIYNTTSKVTFKGFRFYGAKDTELSNAVFNIGGSAIKDIIIEDYLVTGTPLKYLFYQSDLTLLTNIKFINGIIDVTHGWNDKVYFSPFNIKNLLIKNLQIDDVGSNYIINGYTNTADLNVNMIIQDCYFEWTTASTRIPIRIYNNADIYYKHNSFINNNADIGAIEYNNNNSSGYSYFIGNTIDNFTGYEHASSDTNLVNVRNILDNTIEAS